MWPMVWDTDRRDFRNLAPGIRGYIRLVKKLEWMRRINH